ncbi:MAG TPA: ATP-binding protein, partial [Gammaproteobacteria bacterium]|nr:ATP-binding protein [Gammaproteobacteria bacterium]
WLEGRLREWAAQPDGWIVLTGSHGVGKTHLACAIANVRMEQGDRVAFATVPDLLDHLRASYKQDQSESYDQTFKRLLEVKLLVLDDLGAHRSSDWAEEKIYQLINHRYTTRAWTIITMNGKPSDLEDRIASRLTFTELSEVYEVEAPDFRTLRPTS